MRLLAVLLGIIGIVIAATNVWAFFIEWLSLLGILVPPIDAIILMDQFVVRKGSGIDTDWRGSSCRFRVNQQETEHDSRL